jgi:hypothetical protein
MDRNRAFPMVTIVLSRVEPARRGKQRVYANQIDKSTLFAVNILIKDLYVFAP